VSKQLIPEKNPAADSAYAGYLDGAVSGIIAMSAGKFGIAVVLLPLDSAGNSVRA
jgi:hypothetical protein